MSPRRNSSATFTRCWTASASAISQCDQVVIEREGLPPLALVHARDRGSRPIDKILSDPELLNSTVTLDPDFGKDLEEIIAMNRAPCRLTPLE